MSSQSPVHHVPLVFPASDQAAEAMAFLSPDPTAGVLGLLESAASHGMAIDAFAYVADESIVKSMVRAPSESRMLLRYPGGILQSLGRSLEKARPPCAVRVIDTVGDRRSIHAKIYSMHLGGGRRLVVVGSSNATYAGLKHNYETNVAVVVDASTPEERNPCAAFQWLWDRAEEYDPLKHRAEPLLNSEPRFLFDFQTEAIASLGLVRDAIDRGRSSGGPIDVAHTPGCMVSLPTGAGKTLVATRFILTEVLPRRREDGFGRVLWLAEKDEQLEQAKQSLIRDLRGDAHDLKVFRLRPEQDTESIMSFLQHGNVVFSTRTLLSNRLANQHGGYRRLSSAPFDLIVIDEAHHVHSDNQQYPHILSSVPHFARLGLSATPDRHPVEDNPKLYYFFNPAPEQVPKTVPHFIRRLSEVETVEHRGKRVFARPVKTEVRTNVELDLTGIRDDNDIKTKRGSSFSRQERIARIADAFQPDQHRPVLFFAVDIDDANKLTRALMQRSRAQVVHSGSPVVGSWLELDRPLTIAERSEIVRVLREGQLDCIVSVDVFIEGIDIPELQSVFIARPTFSHRVLLQMRGRGLRGPATGGTEECYIFYFEDDILNAAEDRPLQTEQRALDRERGVVLPPRAEPDEGDPTGRSVEGRRMTLGEFSEAPQHDRIAAAVAVLSGLGQVSVTDAVDRVADSLGASSSRHRKAARELVAETLREASRTGRLLKITQAKEAFYKVPISFVNMRIDRDE